MTVTIELVGRSRKFSDDVSGVAWSPDSRLLAAAASKATLVVVDTSTGELVYVDESYLDGQSTHWAGDHVAAAGYGFIALYRRTARGFEKLWELGEEELRRLASNALRVSQG